VPGGIYFNDANWCDWRPGSIRVQQCRVRSDRVSGRAYERESFTDYCREHLFAPLEMTRSTWMLADVAPEEFAFQYKLDPSATAPDQDPTFTCRATWMGACGPAWLSTATFL